MATQMTGIWNQLSAMHNLNNAQPVKTQDTGTSSSSGDDSATISANDFLTLLVTEMQNQDPTADTDPNEYINQLVQVNSLEQLIDINQTLSGDGGSAATSSDSSPSPQTAPASTSPSAAGAASASTSQRAAIHSAGALSGVRSGAAMAQTHPTNLASGNLSAPAANAAAKRVGHALAGRTPARHSPGTLAAR